MIDVDELFEEYFKKYVTDNLGKLTEEQIENNVPEVYERFGSESNEKLGGKSPREYFRSFSDDELIKSIEQSAKASGSVSDFLCEELERRGNVTEKLASLIFPEQNDEVASYAANLLGDDISDKKLNYFVDVISDKKTGESLVECLTEYLSDRADRVKEKVVANFLKDKTNGDCLIEIMSKASVDPRITEILISAFTSSSDKRTLYANYLARYGDASALDVLRETAKKDDISYYDFKEIKNAVSALGGESDDLVFRGKR